MRGSSNLSEGALQLWFNKVVIEEGQLGSTGSMLRSPGRPMDVRRETVLTGIVETPTQRM